MVAWECIYKNVIQFNVAQINNIKILIILNNHQWWSIIIIYRWCSRARRHRQRKIDTDGLGMTPALGGSVVTMIGCSVPGCVVRTGVQPVTQ